MKTFQQHQKTILHGIVAKLLIVRYHFNIQTDLNHCVYICDSKLRPSTNQYIVSFESFWAFQIYNANNWVCGMVSKRRWNKKIETFAEIFQAFAAFQNWNMKQFHKIYQNFKGWFQHPFKTKNERAMKPWIRPPKARNPWKIIEWRMKVYQKVWKRLMNRFQKLLYLRNACENVWNPYETPLKPIS